MFDGTGVRRLYIIYIPLIVCDVKHLSSSKVCFSCEILDSLTSSDQIKQPEMEKRNVLVD